MASLEFLMCPKIALLLVLNSVALKITTLSYKGKKLVIETMYIGLGVNAPFLIFFKNFCVFMNHEDIFFV